MRCTALTFPRPIGPSTCGGSGSGSGSCSPHREIRFRPIANVHRRNPGISMGRVHALSRITLYDCNILPHKENILFAIYYFQIL